MNQGGWRWYLSAGSIVGYIVGCAVVGLAADKKDEKAKRDSEVSDGCREAIELTLQAVKASDAAEEERLYRDAIRGCPTLPEAYYNRALLYRRQGKRELALTDLTKALEVRDDDRFRLGRARVYVELKQYQEAKADYRAVLNRRPGDAAARVGLALVLDKLGDRTEAVSILEEGRASEPNSALIRLNLGVLYELSGRMLDAISEYTRATELDALNGEAWFRRGVLTEQKGEPEDAKPFFEQAIAAGGTTEGAARAALAQLYRSEKAFEHAELILRRGLERSPDNPDLLEELTAVLFDEGRFEQVVEMARMALTHQPRHAAVLTLKGAAERRLGRLEEAERSLRDSLVADEHNPVTHYELALLYRSLGRADESSEHARLSKEMRHRKDKGDLP